MLWSKTGLSTLCNVTVWSEEELEAIEEAGELELLLPDDSLISEPNPFVDRKSWYGVNEILYIFMINLNL